MHASARAVPPPCSCAHSKQVTLSLRSLSRAYLREAETDIQPCFLGFAAEKTASSIIAFSEEIEQATGAPKCPISYPAVTRILYIIFSPQLVHFSHQNSVKTASKHFTAGVLSSTHSHNLVSLFLSSLYTFSYTYIFYVLLIEVKHSTHRKHSLHTDCVSLSSKFLKFRTSGCVPVEEVTGACYTFNILSLLTFCLPTGRPVRQRFF